MKRYDLIVVGSGIAGLFTAVKAAEYGRVAVITKAGLEESNTRYAQGGIAAAMASDDDIDFHIADTLAAGAGLGNAEAVRILCTEGPGRVTELLELGVQFDFDTNSRDFRRGLEAAHSRARVLHAGGDATGAYIETALASALRNRNVDVYEHNYLIDLTSISNAVDGVELIDSAGQRLQLQASSVVLATGGAGQLYRHTTNPGVATGDGVAAAFRAGALIADSEFYQFHPTALALGDTFLISEAVRGEGAILRNATGEAFMKRYDDRAELAPRDVVARAIANEMALQEGQPVLLDATAMDSEFLSHRFPTISSHLLSHGVDWSTTPIPVTPAAHYWMGGIRTDIWGRTSLSGLYAVGETACTGVHGSNRLASNSLLEGIVFAGRVVRHLVAPEVTDDPLFSDELHTLTSPDTDFVIQPTQEDVQNLMWDKVGLIRNHGDLEVASKQLATWCLETPPNTAQANEIRNLITVGRIVTAAALIRTESRGGHFRSDFPSTSDQWRKNLAFTC